MINYFLLEECVATVKIDGNLSRVMGEALASHHRHESEKIKRLEASNERGAELKVMILKWQIKKLERFQLELERIIGHQIGESKHDGETVEML